jgi:hypothetical protein
VGSENHTQKRRKKKKKKRRRRKRKKGSKLEVENINHLTKSDGSCTKSGRWEQETL